MKHIVKSEPPEELIAWAKANAGLPSLQYGDGGFPHAVVHQSLVREQGSLCAYTMRRIDVENSHVEHLKPQTRSRAEGKPAETANYGNIVACYPKKQEGGTPQLKFGAIYRADKWDAAKFLKPTNLACERRMRFRLNGAVQPARSNDAAAVWTIVTLGLADEVLTEWRRQAIEGRGLSPIAENGATRGEAERIVATICTRSGDGRFHPYCVAIKHAAEAYLSLLNQRAKKIKYVRAAKKRRQK